MKNNVTRKSIRIVSFLLSLVIFIGVSLNIFAADTKSEKQYIKDIKLIYAESKEEAKKFVPAGYGLLEYDLNKGTEYVYDVYEVYMAVATTTDPNEAVTDIKMMNMKGGYVYSDYEKQLQDIDDSVREIVDEFVCAVDAFVENYKKGTYGALAAYKALSIFTLDDKDGQNLADYMIYGDPAYEFYVKLVLNVHRDLMATILTALAMAVQGEEGNTWLDRLAQIEDPDKIDEGEGYWEKVCILWEHFYSFYETYSAIDHSIYRGPAELIYPTESGKPEEKPKDEPTEEPEKAPTANVETTGMEVLYEVAHLALEQYSFGNGDKLSEFFVSDMIYEEDFYCMVEVMTPAEYAMMRLCGPLSMILATAMNADVYSDYVAKVDEVMDGSETCSVWEGVNTDLILSSIGITNEACRALAETKYEQELNGDGDSKVTTGFISAGFVAAAGLVVLGLGVTATAIFAGSLGGLLTGAVVSSAAVSLSIAGVLLTATGIGIIVVALVIALVFVVVWLIEWIAEHHPDYTEIPDYMYDYVQDGSGNSQFILYENVRFHDGKNSDLNAWEGKEWHAMYMTHDKAAGAPIEADILVKYGDARIDEDYAALSDFGRVDAVNLNKFADDDDVGGIYVTFRQEKLTGDFARGKYLSHLKIFRDENDEKCKLMVTNEGFVRYDYNLTPGSEYFTYIGYKTTNNEDQAITDIRLAPHYSENQYNAGGGGETYAACGEVGDCLTLYTTRISLFGTPILSDFLVLNDRKDAPLGYEPVNLFSGGLAVNLNDDSRKGAKTYFYFLPSVTYTEGEEYLGGIATVVNELNMTKGFDNAVKEFGYSVYVSVGDSKANTRVGGVVYTTTYNPYRAIYGITAYSNLNEKGKIMPEFIIYDGVNHFKATRIIGENDGYYYHEKSETKSGNDGSIYIQGVKPGATPLKVEDVYASGKDEMPKEGFLPLSGIYSTDGRPVNLAQAFDGNTKVGTSTVRLKMDPMYVYVRGEEHKEGNYVTGIYISSKENILKGVEGDIDCDDVDNSYVITGLSSAGAHHWFSENLNLEESDNTTFLGYTKLHEDDSTGKLYPITNLVLYYAGDNDKKPERDIVIDRISYQLVSNINLFCPEDGTDSSCKRVYLYYTTNPAAGSPIIDIQLDKNAILNGWETVRTQNKQALHVDVDDHSGSMWFLHMKRTNEEPKYIGEIVIGIGGSDADAKAKLVAAGCDYMLEKDLNNNVGAHSDYIYLGYKRTNDPNKAIRDLKTTHDHEVDSLVLNGVTYTKIEGNLNSYTHLFADDIFLYYTKDAKAGTPITSLGTSQSVANWSHGEGNRYVVTTVLNHKGKPSDLNKNCGYQSDYIYLLQTRDKQDEKLLGAASMIGNGSIAVIVAFVAVTACVAAGIVIWQRKRKVKALAVAQKASEEERSE